MAAIGECFDSVATPTGLANGAGIEVTKVVHTTRSLTAPPALPVPGSAPAATESSLLRVTVPDFITHYTYLIATDERGVVLGGTVDARGQGVRGLHEVPLNEGERTAFVHVVCTKPEAREFTRFLPLTQEPNENKYACMVGLMEKLERALVVVDERLGRRNAVSWP